MKITNHCIQRYREKVSKSGTVKDILAVMRRIDVAELPEEFCVVHRGIRYVVSCGRVVTCYPVRG